MGLPAWSRGPGRSSCTDCLAGYYLPTSGQSICLACESGRGSGFGACILTLGWRYVFTSTGDLISGVVILLSLRGKEHSRKLSLSSTLHTDTVRLVDMGTVRFSKCLTKGKPPQCLLHLDSFLHRGTHSSSAAATSCVAPWLSIYAGVCCTGRLLESVELHMFQGICGMYLTEFEWFGWLRSVVLELMQHHQQPLAPPVPWVAMVSSSFFEDLTEMRMDGGWVQSW